MSSRYHFPITLGMIVKDEERIIQRCLDSVKDHITGYVIIDTGSTDATKKIIEETLEGIPGKILDRPWVDFGFNRSELVVEAQNFVLNSVPAELNTGYLLLLDADHILNGDFSGVSNDDGYLIELIGDNLGYSMPYLVAADLPWRYIGRTHEYITAEGFNGVHAPLKTCTLDHRGDGGNRYDKFAKDLKYLEEDYKQDPNNERVVYYLGQTYEGMGRRDEALELFRRRAQLGGFDQEQFWAAFKVAEITQYIGDYLQAFLMRPTRTEPIQRAMSLLNQQQKYQSVLALARMCPQQPSDDHLFVERWTEQYGAAFEFCLALWYTGDVAKAKQGWEAMLDLPELSDQYRELIKDNLTHC